VQAFSKSDRSLGLTPCWADRWSGLDQPLAAATPDAFRSLLPDSPAAPRPAFHLRARL